MFFFIVSLETKNQLFCHSCPSKFCIRNYFHWTNGIWIQTFLQPEVYLQWKWNQESSKPLRPLKYFRLQCECFIISCENKRSPGVRSILYIKVSCHLWLFPHWLDYLHLRKNDMLDHIFSIWGYCSLQDLHSCIFNSKLYCKVGYFCLSIYFFKKKIEFPPLKICWSLSFISYWPLSNLIMDIQYKNYYIAVIFVINEYKG